MLSGAKSWGRRPPSVALVTASLSSSGGGVAHVVRAIGTRLRSRNDTTRLYGVMHRGAADEEASCENRMLCSIIPAKMPSSFAFAPGLYEAIDHGNHDLLHLHGLWLYPSIVASRWRSCKGRPVIISPHGMLDPWALRHSRWKKEAAMALFERRNCVMLHACMRSV